MKLKETTLIIFLVITLLLSVGISRRHRPSVQLGGHYDQDTILFIKPDIEQPPQPQPKATPIEDKMIAILTNQHKLLKAALGSRIQKKKVATKPKCIQAAPPAMTRVYKNWAPNSTATQSSTYGGYAATNAIDGNKKTFNHTEIKPNENSWLKIALSTPIEINKIVIENRSDSPGSLAMRKRLPPFTITVKNKAGIVVASKTFEDILQTYVWNDVFSVGSEVMVQQQKKNHLHIAEIQIFGIQAHDCNYYEKQTALNRQRVSPMFQQLKTSACLAPQSPLGAAETMKAQADRFNKIIKKHTEKQKAKTEQAKTLWNKIQKQQVLENQLAAQAKRFGLAPPKPLYSAKQIESVKQNMEAFKPNLTVNQKADCMSLYNQIQELKRNVDKLTSNLKAKAPSEETITKLKILTDQINKLDIRYKQECLPEDSRQDLTSTALSPDVLPESEEEPTLA
jgi:polyhydroxyalkanoate synthesis regulator phasin